MPEMIVNGMKQKHVGQSNLWQKTQSTQKFQGTTHWLN